MGFTLGLKSVLILVVTALSAKQALGKPLNERQLDDGSDYSFHDMKIAPNQFVNKFALRQNGNSFLGRLRDFCSSPGEGGLQDKTRQSPCEAGWYPCFGHAEVVCKKYSLVCLDGLKKYGFPKCAAKYEWVTINLGSERIKVKRTEGCFCA